MNDSFQTEQTEQEGELHQQFVEPQLTFMQRFQQKFAESRYFMLSCVIHTIIVIIMASIVYKSMVEQPAFVPGGGDVLIPTDDLPPPTESPKEAVPVEAQVTPKPTINRPIIDVIQTTSTATDFKVPPQQTPPNLPNPTDLTKPTGNIATIGGGLGSLPGVMKCRLGPGKAKAMTDNKMKPKAEQAVLRGLAWLQKNQASDGSWGDSNKGAMTGLALLCFLGHGETPQSQQFGYTVNKAVEWILTNGAANEGRLCMSKSFAKQPDAYEHAICTYALGEYYTMTQDPNVKELFKQAIGYIVQGQGLDGGWMYSYDKSAGDLSVSGWQIQALKAAHLSKLGIYEVDQALDKAMAYLEHSKGPKGGYGYRGPADKYSLSGVGILCQLFWKGERAKLKKGMEWVLLETEKNEPVKYQGPKADLYAWYYHTQACLMFGGSAWTKWNNWFQDEIVNAQAADGSWPPMAAPGVFNMQNGNGMSATVYRTTLCILMLEVFYRYVPPNREG